MSVTKPAITSQEITYIASPYSHPRPLIREKRFAAVTRAAGDLMRGGLIIYSPITHGHAIHVNSLTPMPSDWAFWREQCLAMLAVCSEMIVLQLPEWERSVGVAAEIDFAIANHIPIKYQPVDDLWNIKK